MFTNECGGSDHNWAMVLIRKGRMSGITEDTEVWGPHATLDIRSPTIDGQDAIGVNFTCGAFFGEVVLDREQAGLLLDRLGQAVFDYDRGRPERPADPTTPHPVADCLA